MEKEAFQLKLMKEAAAYGFEDCEVYYASGASFEALIFEQEISHFENSMQRGICFRGIWQGKMGYSYSEWMEEQAISFLLEEARQNAIVIEEKVEPLFSGGVSYPSLFSFQQSLQEISPMERIEAAKKIEQAAKEFSPCIKMTDTCAVGYSEEEISIQNTKGLSVKKRENIGFAYVSAVAEKEGQIKTGSEFWMDRNPLSFIPKEIGQKAAEDAVSHFGAVSIQSGEYQIVLKNLVMASLLNTFCGIFFGENVQKGFSLLKGKTGEKIASDSVTLRDDGLYPHGFSSAPFDSEGVPCKNKILVEKGILKTLLYDLKSAGKENRESTGNGFKLSLPSPIQTSCTNFYLENGTKTLEELWKSMENGLYITEVAGLHAGANSTSGDFSLSAEGFLIENGMKKGSIEQIVIAGNFYELLHNILEKGNDLRFGMPGGNGTMGSPCVWIKKLAVSGL